LEEYIKLPNFDGKLTIQQIFLQMLDAIEELHGVGYIHKDVKPDNFRIQDNRVVIIDFGLIMEYKRDGKHFPRERYGFEGTPFYGSIRALQGYTLSRRDDLESLGYSFLYLLDP
jgi:serine/threonine protein kinase